MIAMLAASQGLSPDDPSFWMPLAFMALLFVVIAAGGHGGLGTEQGDYVVAFALPRTDEDTP